MTNYQVNAELKILIIELKRWTKRLFFIVMVGAQLMKNTVDHGTSLSWLTVVDNVFK